MNRNRFSSGLILISIITVFIIFTTLMIQGCGSCSRSIAQITGVSRECVDGVEYLQFSSGVTVAYNPDGTVKQCKKN